MNQEKEINLSRYGEKMPTDIDLTVCALEMAILDLSMKPSKDYLLIVNREVLKEGLYKNYHTEVAEVTEELFKKEHSRDIKIWVLIDHLLNDIDAWTLVSINGAVWSPGA